MRIERRELFAAAGASMGTTRVRLRPAVNARNPLFIAAVRMSAVTAC